MKKSDCRSGGLVHLRRVSGCFPRPIISSMVHPNATLNLRTSVDEQSLHYVASRRNKTLKVPGLLHHLYVLHSYELFMSNSARSYPTETVLGQSKHETSSSPPPPPPVPENADSSRGGSSSSNESKSRSQRTRNGTQIPCPR